MFSGSPRREAVHKKHSAKAFNRASGRTASINMRAAPMRGGWRL